MFNYHLQEVDHSSSNDVHTKHRASRGLSAIAELLVIHSLEELESIENIVIIIVNIHVKNVEIKSRNVCKLCIKRVVI